MSIWKELYDIFDKERSRFDKKSADKQSVTFEIQKNATFLADAMESSLENIKIIYGLEHSVFDQAITTGFDFNSIVNSKLRRKEVEGFSEFYKYINKDTAYLIKNLYLKISLSKKIAAENPKRDVSLKIKSLFRFYVLVISHIERVPLKKEH